MFKKLLQYNWSLFISSLTKTQAIISLIYALLVGVLLFNLAGGILYVALFSIDSSRHNIEWLTPEILDVLLLVTANSLWLVQFTISGERHYYLSENRKLLSLGYPVKRLSRDLAILTFLHPLNLGINIAWLLFLLPRSSATGFILMPIAVLVNYFCLIYLKSRLAYFFKKRLMWIGGFFVALLFSLLFLLPKETVKTWLKNLDPQTLIESMSYYLSLLPGGLMEQTIIIASQPLGLFVASLIGVALILLLYENQHSRLKAVLSAPINENTKKTDRSYWPQFKAWIGNSGGKYNYYVIQHPYTKLQLIMTVPIIVIALPIFITESAVTLFMLHLFGMLIPMGLCTLFLFNVFGFENKEWLLSIQFPQQLNEQIRERFVKAILVPGLAFVGVTLLELFFSKSVIDGGFLILKNVFMCLVFFYFSFWSSFHNYRNIPWSSYNQWTNPIIPQSVSLILGFIFMICGIIVYYPSPVLEPYIMLGVIAGIIFLSIHIRKKLSGLAKRFRINILPELWNAQ